MLDNDSLNLSPPLCSSYISNSTATIVVAVISSIVGVAACAALGFGCFVWRRRRHNSDRKTITNYPARRPNEQVDLFDTRSSLRSPSPGATAGGNSTTRTVSNDYEPVPYTPRDESNMLSGSATGLSAGAMLTSSTSRGDQTMSGRSQTGRAAFPPSSAWHSTLDGHHPDDPFNGRGELSPEESMAFVRERRWPSREISMDTTTSAGGLISSRDDSGSRTGTPLLRHQTDMGDDTVPNTPLTPTMTEPPPPPLPPNAAAMGAQHVSGRSKEEEVWEEAARTRQSRNENNHISATAERPTSDAPTLRSSPPPTSTTVGTFRVTNAGEGDPVLPPPPASATATYAPANTTGPRRRRMYDPFDTAQPRFVRHADAGRFEGGAEVIDLPPLYTDLDHTGSLPPETANADDERRVQPQRRLE